MRKTIFAAAWAVAMAATASALDVGVGAFYAPGRVVAGAGEIEGVNNPGGIKGRVSAGIYEGFNVAFGVGYNDFSFRKDVNLEEEEGPARSIPMVILALGADYAFRLGPFRPYAGGGGAIARESVEGFGYTNNTWYGGLYAEGGTRYFITNDWALEAGPRYTLLFDKHAPTYYWSYPGGLVRSEERSQLVELLVGINYYF
jgi:opacity protein-like surface antigen